MKKEIFAVLLLLILFGISIFNAEYLEQLTLSLTEDIELVKDAASNGNWDAAGIQAAKAVQKWHSKDKYTHVVLKHSDIDSMTDDFYELLEHVYSQDAGATLGSVGLVTAHLKSISMMEKIRLGSIF